MSHITRQGRIITEVRCPMCNVPIRTMAPTGETLSVERKGNLAIKSNPVTLVCCANYAEVEFEVLNPDTKQKGRHISCMCWECARKLERQHYAAIYRMDMAELGRDGMDLRRMAEFVPVKVKNVSQEPIV